MENSVIVCVVIMGVVICLAMAIVVTRGTPKYRVLKTKHGFTLVVPILNTRETDQHSRIPFDEESNDLVYYSLSLSS